MRRREGEKERRRSQFEGGEGAIYALASKLAYASAVLSEVKEV